MLPLAPQSGDTGVVEAVRQLQIRLSQQSDPLPSVFFPLNDQEIAVPAPTMQVPPPANACFFASRDDDEDFPVVHGMALEMGHLFPRIEMVPGVTSVEEEEGEISRAEDGHRRHHGVLEDGHRLLLEFRRGSLVVESPVRQQVVSHDASMASESQRPPWTFSSESELEGLRSRVRRRDDVLSSTTGSTRLLQQESRVEEHGPSSSSDAESGLLQPGGRVSVTRSDERLLQSEGVVVVAPAPPPSPLVTVRVFGELLQPVSCRVGERRRLAPVVVRNLSLRDRQRQVLFSPPSTAATATAGASPTRTRASAAGRSCEDADGALRARHPRLSASQVRWMRVAPLELLLNAETAMRDHHWDEALGKLIEVIRKSKNCRVGYFMRARVRWLQVTPPPDPSRRCPRIAFLSVLGDYCLASLGLPDETYGGRAAGLIPCLERRRASECAECFMAFGRFDEAIEQLLPFDADLSALELCWLAVAYREKDPPDGAKALRCAVRAERFDDWNSLPQYHYLVEILRRVGLRQ